MTSDPAHPAADHDPLAPLVDEFVERWQRGERPTIAEYAERHPDLADELRELLPMVVTLEDAKDSGGSSDGAIGGAVPVEQLGDYRLLREIGRGGMGIVYEAEQQSLGRRVAVKVLPPQLLADRRQIERFEREARTAAGLHHTNIVPIFGVGSADNYHYYVMQYIRGVGLDIVSRELAQRIGDDAHGVSAPSLGAMQRGGLDVLSVGRALAAEVSSTTPTTPTPLDMLDLTTRTVGGAEILLSGSRDAEAMPETPSVVSAISGGRGHWRSVAQIGLQVADALAYAHTQGTLHRDIKPGNLLLDTDGTVWVADFGLARAVDQSALTQPGDVVGTLRYMAPEQFKGQVDARCDVYSLGVTLYELATLRPAFAATTRGELIDAIMAGRLPSPRSIGVRMPRDLETILLKATAREQGDRYASSAELAEDLRRFLSDVPVRARRVTATEQAWRWARRNPAVATLLGSVAVLLVAIAGLASAGYYQTQRSNAEVRHALAGETLQRQRAERVSDLALDALDTIFDKLAPQAGTTLLSTSTSDSGDEDASVSIPVAPAVSSETAALLEEMLVFYEALAADPNGSQRLQPRIAEANYRIGEIHQRLGEYDAALEAYARARELFTQLSEQSPDDESPRLALARLQIAEGRIAEAQEEFIAANLAYAGAHQALRESADTRSPAWQLELVRVCYLLAQPPQRVIPEPEQPDHQRPPGGGLLGGLFDGPPPQERGRRERGGRRGPGGPPDGSGPPGHGPPGLPTSMRVGLLAEALNTLGGLIAASPALPEYRRWQARCLCAWPTVPGEEVEGESPARQGIKILEQLVADHPESPEYRFDLAQAYAGAHAGRPVETFELERAAALLGELVRERPNVPAYAVLLARVSDQLSRHALQAGDSAAAEQHLRNGLALQQQLAQRFPESMSYGAGVCLFELSLADVLIDQGRRDEAAECIADALERLDRLAGTGVRQPPYVRGLRRHAQRTAYRLEQPGPPRPVGENGLEPGDLRPPPRRGQGPPRLGPPPRPAETVPPRDRQDRRRP